MKPFREVKEELKNSNLVYVSDRHDLWFEDNELMVYDNETQERIDHINVIGSLKNIDISKMYRVIKKLEKEKRKMKAMKLKEIKNLVLQGRAKDITHDEKDYHDLRIIGVSVGIYGRNGLLLEDDEHNQYAITKRATNIFKY